MNEIVPAQPKQTLAAHTSGPSGALIERADGEFARKAAAVAWSLDSTVTMWDGFFRENRRAEKPVSHRGGAIPPIRYSTDRDHLQAEIARGEEMLANATFQALAAELAPFVSTATVAQIKHEIAKLLAAFPTKDDLTAYTALLFEEIIGEKPLWLALAMACREVRRNSRFRPSIAEVLEALEEADWYACRSDRIVRLPKYVAALKRHLAELERLLAEAERLRPSPLQQALADCGCFVCPDKGGHSVVGGEKRFAGPFTTETEAWSWLEENAEALAAAPAEQLLARKKLRHRS